MVLATEIKIEWFNKTKIRWDPVPIRNIRNNVDSIIVAYKHFRIVVNDKVVYIVGK